MGAPGLSDLFDFGKDVMSAALDAASNAISIVLGDSTSGSSDPGTHDWVQHSGFASVPAPPSQGKPSCQVVYLRRGDRKIAIGSKDLRASDRYGNLSPGECAIYATVGQARVICGSDGSVTLYTTAGNVGGPGDPALSFKLSPKGIYFFAPWGKFVYDATGLHMKHGTSTTNFKVDAGGMNLPGPLAALGGYFDVTAPTITLSGICNLGTSPTGLYNPVVWVLNEDPLTLPGIPLTAVGFGAPWGGFASASVRVAGAPGTG